MNQDVIFLYDDMVEKVYEEYREAFRIQDYEEKMERYLELGQVLKNYTLSIPLEYCRNFVQDNGMLILPKEGIKQFYNPKTGFIREDKNEVLIF